MRPQLGTSIFSTFTKIHGRMKPNWKEIYTRQYEWFIDKWNNIDKTPDIEFTDHDYWMPHISTLYDIFELMCLNS